MRPTRRDDRSLPPALGTTVNPRRSGARASFSFGNSSFFFSAALASCSSSASVTIAESFSFFFSSFSSRFRRSSNFFTPPLPEYGLPFADLLLALCLSEVPNRGISSRSSCMTANEWTGFCLNMSGIDGAPRSLLGKRGVLYISNSCKAFSAALKGR